MKPHLRAAGALLLLFTASVVGVPAPPPPQQQPQQPADFLNVNGLPLMMPLSRTTNGRKWYFEMPRDPVGLLVMLHRCGRNAEDFWPPSTSCPQCIGMPEAVSISRQALARGYALLAPNSFNRSVGARGRCWSWADDAVAVQQIVTSFRGNTGLDSKPLFFTGCSSGGSLALRLPGIMKIDGIMPVAIGLDMDVFPPARPDQQFPFPPVAYVHFANDTFTSEKIADMIAFSTQRGLPAAEQKVGQFAVGPNFFSRRDPMISVALSQRLQQGIKALGILDENNLIRQDAWPDGSPAPWDQMLLNDLPDMIKAAQNEQLALKNESTLSQAQDALAAAGEELLTIQEVSADSAAAADDQANSQDSNPNFSDSDGMSPAGGADDPYLSPKLLYQHIQEELAVAYAHHTNLGDYMTGALMWMERCGQASFTNLAARLEVHSAAELSPVRNATSDQVLRTWQACQPGAVGGGPLAVEPLQPGTPSTGSGGTLGAPAGPANTSQATAAADSALTSAAQRLSGAGIAALAVAAAAALYVP